MLKQKGSFTSMLGYLRKTYQEDRNLFWIWVTAVATISSVTVMLAL